jgi:branched-chain amino acid transport system substrate-binding protein
MAPVDRRQFLKGSTAIAAIGSLAGCREGDNGGGGNDGGGGGGGNDGGSGNDGGGETTGDSGGGGGFSGTVKVAYVGALSGPFGSNGQRVRDGFMLAADKVNNSDQFDFEIETFQTDDEASPENAVSNARRLLNEEDVDAFVAGESTSQAIAMSEFAASQDVLHIAPVTASRDLSGQAYQDTTFHMSDNLDELAAAAARTQAEQINPTRIAGVMPDYAFGRKVWDAYQHFAEQEIEDFEIVESVFPGFGQGDYQNEIQAVTSAEPDVVVSALWAGDLITFIQQATEFGMFEDVPNYQSIGGVDLSAAEALGADTVPDAMISGPLYYPFYPDNELNNQFVQNFRDEHDQIPLEANGCGYKATIGMATGIAEAGSKETNAMIDGLEGLEFESVEGTSRVRADDHKCIDPQLYVGRVGPVEDAEDFIGLSNIWPVDNNPEWSTNTETYGNA